MVKTEKKVFRTPFAQSIFEHKYQHRNAETWEELAHTLVEDVCADLVPQDTKEALIEAIASMKFIPGGRYLYYAGRPRKYFNNCYLLRSEEDTKEDWAQLSWKAERCLTTGGGIGNDYSIYRPQGSIIKGSGGQASGPLSKMKMINEIGREVMQGGNRRSAIYASLNWRHGDADKFLKIKNWDDQFIAGTNISFGELKKKDFNFPCPLDMTNISLNYDNAFLDILYGVGNWKEVDKKIVPLQPVQGLLPETFLNNCFQAMSTGEPGFSFNFGSKENETLRNACTEVTSEDDSDVCNLGSINMSRISTIEEFEQIVELASQFLLCGTFKADLPYEKIYQVRRKNRRLGLGLMGIHEWLLQRSYRYEMVPELQQWLQIYRDSSEKAANQLADSHGISRPVAYRAIAPTGTIGILAGTTTGIEPLFAVAYKRRFYKDSKWHFQFVVDGTAKLLINEYGLNPDNIESAVDLATDYERRIKFQADIQDYVDMSISSTINLPMWGSENNNQSQVEVFAHTLAKYAHRLRGFTCYPDGSRGGQPLTPVSYQEAISTEGREYVEEHTDICEISGGGICGV